MPRALRVEERGVSLQSDFNGPSFELFKDLSVLQDLYEALSPLGLKLTDMRMETVGSLGDIHLLIYVLNFAGIIRVRLDKIEIQALDLNRISLGVFDDIVRRVLEGVRKSRDSIRFARHTVGIELHGKIDGETPAAFVSGLVSTKIFRELGPEVGRGLIQYFGADGPRLMSSIILDLSQRIVDGLYVRVQGVWDGGKLPPEKVIQTAQDLVSLTLRALDVEIQPAGAEASVARTR